jgi:glutamate--cysteine ligase
MAGRLPASPGERPTMDDWSDHLTTLFPEVRMKKFLEMRGADGGRWRRICALPAFWVGLLYDDEALDAAWQLVKGWSAEERQALRNDVPRLAFDAKLGKWSVREISGETLAIARAGLARRKRLDAKGRDETIYLKPLDELVASGKTVADELLEKYEGPWGRNIDHVFPEMAF